MPITIENQISLLKDILNNHQLDACGSVSECEQVERLVKSLIANGTVNSHVKEILEEISRYSQDGIQTGDLDNHISSHQQQLTQWVDDINSYS